MNLNDEVYFLLRLREFHLVVWPLLGTLLPLVVG